MLAETVEGGGVSDRAASDVVFTASVPELYDRHLVPLILRSYADEVAVPVGRDAVLG